MTKGILSACFILGVAISGFSQKIDSLENLLDRKEDTIKVNLLNRLSKLYVDKGDNEKSELRALEAKEIAEKIDYPVGVYESYMCLSLIADMKAEFVQSTELLTKAVKIAEDLKRDDLLVKAKLSLGTAYKSLHYRAKGLKLSLEAYETALKLNKKETLAEALRHVAVAYSNDGNLELSIRYTLQLVDLWTELQKPGVVAICYSNIAEDYANLKKYDSAIYFHKKAIETYEKSGESRNMAYLLSMVGKTYTKNNDYNNALIYFNRALTWSKEKSASVTVYGYCLLKISEIAFKQNEGNEGNLRKDYAKITGDLVIAIDQFKKQNAYTNLLKAYSLMREINERTGNYKKANEYLKEVLITKDTLNNREQKAKVKELMIQYQVKESEQQIAQLQKEKSTNNLLIVLLVGSLVLIIFSIILFISRQRLRYRNEKRELELSALRSQMNPHFIYNCLSSISLYIIQSEVVQATDYLTKFAKLMRSILDNSKHSFVSLTDEIKTLSLYIDLEAIRFNSKFSYKINVGEGVETESMMLSPMIIQPFVENAIWHGLQHKVEPGHIQIGFTIKNKALLCTVQDNGVGRKKTSELHGKSSMLKKTKSHGIQITKERLNLLSRKGLKTSLEIIDLMDDDNNPVGTKVEIELPIQRLS